MPPAPPKKPDRTAAERKRRERARARAGKVLLKMEVPTTWVEELLERGLLQGDQIEDPEAIGRIIMKAAGQAGPGPRERR